MKTQNIFGGVCTALLFMLGSSSSAQSFEKTIYEPGSDMNHYSIEAAPNGDYVLAGTLFRPGGNQDIQVMRLDPNGNILWTVNMDHSPDDRALDVAVDPFGDIVVVGYIEDLISPSDADLYAVKLDGTGGFIADLQVDGFHTAAGTNVIYSAQSGTYIVGGYMGEPFQVPMVGCVARILELDLGLNVINNQELSTVHMKHASINDIIETSNGYFITGSMANTVTSPLTGEGVLAVFLDVGLSVTADLSFESTNSEHVGVSAVYDKNVDEVWLMSNNSVIHNPQISQIKDVSGTPAIGTEYYLELDPSYGSHNAAGFKLALSPYNSKSLVAAGLFRTHNDYLGNQNSATPWIVEFKRNSGSQIGAFIWPAPSPNFHSHGGGLFSTFSGEHPYFFNQELMIPRPDKRGFTIVGPIEENGDFGIDVVTTIDLQKDMPCFEPIKYDPIAITHFDNPVVVDPQSVLDFMPGYDYPDMGMKEIVWCKEMYDYKSSEDTDGEETGAPSSIDMNGAKVSVYPNPILNAAFIEISGKDLTGHQFDVRNSLGQVIFSSAVLEGNYYSDRIDLGEFPAGVYFLTLTDNNTGAMEVSKLIKQ
ncbi:MAG: hypothetical protein ACI8ZM_003783 [Crocinitomix sp.]|jgi:hypothetical protein